MLKQAHLQEIQNIEITRDEVKKMNMNISSINREKESISSSILYIRRHIEQLEQKINNQSNQTREFISEVKRFEKKLKNF